MILTESARAVGRALIISDICDAWQPGIYYDYPQFPTSPGQISGTVYPVRYIQFPEWPVNRQNLYPVHPIFNFPLDSRPLWPAPNQGGIWIRIKAESGSESGRDLDPNQGGIWIVSYPSTLLVLSPMVTALVSRLTTTSGMAIIGCSWSPIELRLFS